MLFKSLALVFYLLLNIFVGNEIITFIMVMLMHAFDFWTVKNVTGRILVGLRWGNRIKEDGSNEWVYDSINASHFVIRKRG